ncbi:MAG TPA: efflux RND transporter permease subunit [Longimicrobiales bacterium]|nr:efflux RND transporter permease subunit [Longimicrobiales bacterium]
MIGAAVRRPISIAMLFLAIALLGIPAFRNIPIELLPDATLPRLSVSATWPGTSPEVTEAFLTAPLESVIQQIRGVEKIESQSAEGLARIDITFGRGTDMDFARLELSERLASLEDELPIGATAPRVSMYVPDEFRDQQLPVLSYSVHGPYVLEWLRERVEEEVAAELIQLEGVGVVVVSGGRARVLQIELDERRIQSLGLQLADVAARVASLEIVREAGLVDTPAGIQRTLTIRHRPESAAEVAAHPLLVDRGRVVKLADVARVYATYDEATEYHRIDGQPAVSFSVFKAPGANTVAMADAVKARLAELAPALGTGMAVQLELDQSEEIRRQLSDLRSRAAISAIIVLVVLLLFLGSLRASIIVFATVAFAVLITLNVSYFAGLSLNVLTLMGLAMGFGLVVDNAIVVLENIYRRRRGGESAAHAAERGTREVVLPILAATGTTVVVLVPFVYLQGELRIYYVPLALVVGIALLASMFVAFTFIPSLAGRLLARLPATATAPAALPDLAAAARADAAPAAATLPLVARAYRGLVRATLRRPWLALASALLLLGGSGLLFQKYVSRGMLWGGWGGQSTYISINIRQPRGEELARTDELARYFEARLRELPEVEQFVTRVRATNADIRVTFPDSLENTDVPVAIKDLLYQYSLGYGGAEVRVYGYGPSFYGGSGSAPNYSIRILGYNYETARFIAEDLGRRLQRYSRIREVDTNSGGGFFDRDRATELVLELDRGRLSMHDLSAEDVVRQVSAAARGRASAARVNVGGEELQLSVKLAGFRYMDAQQLMELLLPAGSGTAVRLGDVATLRERQVQASIVRENQQYRRVVSYEFRGPAKLGDRVRESVIAATALPPGYRIEEQQAWSWQPEQKTQIYLLMAIAVLLVYMLTAALFESLRQPLCVLLTVPMALIGVFLLFFYTGASFTREAYVGVIMMSGIVVNNSILLVDHINQLRRRAGLPLRDALERGALERVRPILMTSMTTILGLLPLVLFSESADASIWNALAYALIGGLSSSTVLVLTVTPALYLLFERGLERRSAVRIPEPRALTAAT